MELVAKKMSPEARLRHQKRLQAITSLVGGTTGLTALGLLAAKKPKPAAKLTTVGAGIGGAGAFNFASIQNKESKLKGPKQNVYVVRNQKQIKNIKSGLEPVKKELVTMDFGLDTVHQGENTEIAKAFTLRLGKLPKHGYAPKHGIRGAENYKAKHAPAQAGRHRAPKTPTHEAKHLKVVAPAPTPAAAPAPPTPKVLVPVAAPAKSRKRHPFLGGMVTGGALTGGGILAGQQVNKSLNYEKAGKLFSSFRDKGNTPLQRRTFQLISRAERGPAGNRRLGQDKVMNGLNSRNNIPRAGRKRGVQYEDMQREIFARSDTGRAGYPNPWVSKRFSAEGNRQKRLDRYANAAVLGSAAAGAGAGYTAFDAVRLKSAGRAGVAGALGLGAIGANVAGHRIRSYKTGKGAPYKPLARRPRD